MNKKRITKSIAVILLSAFSINICCYGQGLSISRQHTLAPPSIFQKSSPTEDSKEFKESVISDVNLLGVCLSIARYFLIDEKDKEGLIKYLRDKFRNDRKSIELVTALAQKADFARNRKKEKIVALIPHEREGEKYVIKIYNKNKLRYVKKEDTDWGVFDEYGRFRDFGGFGVQVVPLSETKTKEDYTEEKIRELIKKGKTIVLADDGEEFTFLLEPRKDIDNHAFSIKVFHKGRYVGYNDIFRNRGSSSFDSAYSPYRECGVFVIHDYRPEDESEGIGGIGRALVSFGLGVVKSNGYDTFTYRPIKMGKIQFFEHLGFQRNPDNTRELVFDLTSQSLPMITIHKKPDQGLHTAISKDMERIHTINMSLLPSVETGKTLWHVIPIELIPPSIKKRGLVRRIRQMQSKIPGLKEKIRFVNSRNLHRVVSALTMNENNIVEVALNNEEDLKGLPERVKALVFEGDAGGYKSFKQLELIIAALRALYKNDAKTLIKLYNIVSDEPFSGSEMDIINNINNPARLVEYIKFNLKPIEIHDPEALRKLNEQLIQLIQSA